MNIKVYAREIEDGLESKIKNNALAYCSVARHVELTESDIDKHREIIKSSAKANPSQIDLFYLDAVLASVGWNKNDDVFDRLHTWAARKTPEDKPFNYEHSEKDIIGHITASQVFGPDGKQINDDTSVEDLPQTFDVVVGSVLYRKFDDEELQKRADQLIREIAEGKWFVSMECLFPDFDYAVITPEGDQKVIARNSDSSFLTKHLRCYGGSGEYQGHKLGRLLKNFVFSGKGLVSNPANKRSVILNSSDTFSGAYASTNFLMETKMQEQLDRLVAENKTLSDEMKALRDAQTQAIAKEVEEYKGKLATAQKGLAELQTQFDAYKEVVAAKDEKIAELTANAEDLTKKLDEAKAELAKISEEKVEAGRLAQLSQVVDDEKRAKALVEKFKGVSDEVFTELVEALANTAPKSEAEKAAAAELTPETTKVEDKPNLGVNTNEVVERQKAAASWFTSGVLNTTAKLSK